MDSSELARWLALRRAGLGSTNFARLIARYGTLTAAWEAPASELPAAGLEPQFVRAFLRARAEFEPRKEVESLGAAGARVLTWMDPDYPTLLRHIPQSPPVLFVRGEYLPQFTLAVAVVGTRRVSAYGRQVTEEFCSVLAAAGTAIVSGLARGVDAIAHRVALESGATTAAVLAGGIDQVFPRENAGLAERVMDSGCLVSEYPVGIPARPDYFPRRNRILAGLAHATLVIEAGEGSGALHTANWAFEQGREVFAVPGSILSRQSEGCHRLIRDTIAKLVVAPTQVLEELHVIGGGGQYPLALERAGSVPDELPPTAGQGLLERITARPQHIDEIARGADEPVESVAARLAVLELSGQVRQVAPMTFVRSPSGTAKDPGGRSLTI